MTKKYFIEKQQCGAYHVVALLQKSEKRRTNDDNL